MFSVGQAVRPTDRSCWERGCVDDITTDDDGSQVFIMVRVDDDDDGRKRGFMGVTPDEIEPIPLERRRPRRKGIGLRLRFSVLRRCNFRCAYCGVPSAHARLEIDHVVPVASGGRSVVDNLVAACFKCNRGKASLPLS